jgi:hypothetical protein
LQSISITVLAKKRAQFGWKLTDIDLGYVADMKMNGGILSR